MSFISFYHPWSPVFSLYKSLSASEQQQEQKGNEIGYVFNPLKSLKEKKELKDAQIKIRQLEERIEELELRLPKKYEAVKFLNYHNRKRILVSSRLFRDFK